MRLRICLLAAALFVGVIVAHSQEWEWQHPWPTNTLILDVASIDNQKMIMIGWDGTLIETSDDGTTWSKVNLNTNQSWYASSTVPGGYAWVVGERGNIAYTHNGGKSWSLRTIPINHHWYDVAFVDSMRGWAMSANVLWGTVDGGNSWEQLLEYEGYRLYQVEAVGERIIVAARDSNDELEFIKSSDGGETWSYRTAPSGSVVYEMKFVSQSLGWILTGGQEGHFLLRTTTGGYSWEELSIGSLSEDEDLISMDFLDENFGWVLIGGTDSLAITENGGDSWRIVETGIDLPIREVFFTSRTHGWLTATSLLYTGYQWSEIFRTVDGGETWTQIERQTNATLRDIAFIDEEMGWAVGDNSTALWTEDHGEHWEELESPIGVSANVVEIAPDGTVWMGGDIGAVYYFDSDSEDLHVSVLPDPDSRPRDIFFQSEQDIVVVTSKHVFRTADRGENWVTLPVEVDTNHYLKSVEFVDSDRGWLLGYKYFRTWDPIMPNNSWHEPLLLRTTNGGDSWVEQTIAAEYFVPNYVDFVTARIGWIAGSNIFGPMILKTNNGGETWTEQYGRHELPSWGGAVCEIGFVNSTKGWAVGSDGLILHTINGGETWERQYAGTRNRFYALEISHGKVWACGEHGVIINLDDINSVAPHPNPLPVSYRLSVFPNPFNSTTNLLLDLSREGRATVDIYNVQGQLVERLFEGMMYKGENRIRFDAMDLPSGLYFANVTGSLSSTTRKLVLVK